MGFLSGLVTFFKGVQALKALVDQFVELWVYYDIDRIEDQAEARKQEFDALKSAMERTTNDQERLALLRIAADRS